MKTFVKLVLLMSCYSCSQVQDNIVYEAQDEIASSLRFHKKLMDKEWSTQIESFRVSKHAALADARTKALLAMTATEKNSPKEIESVVDYFSALNNQLDVQCDIALAKGLEAHNWLLTAADGVMAAKHYQQTKDTALIQAALAALKSFGETYVSNRPEAKTPAQKQGQQTLDSMNAELTNLLKSKLSTTVGGI